MVGPNTMPKNLDIKKSCQKHLVKLDMLKSTCSKMIRFFFNDYIKGTFGKKKSYCFVVLATLGNYFAYLINNGNVC
jgi:hypothetical protein